MNTAKRLTAGFGTQTSALSFGGENPGTAFIDATESYNGTAWAEVNNLNTARDQLAAAGTDNTSGLAFGGNTPPLTANTEVWNGYTWTEVNNLNEARRVMAGCGTSTAALCFGGFADPGVGYRATTENWNGTNWTEVNDLNTARSNMGGVGTNTAGLAFAGFRDPPPGPIEQ